MTDKLQADPTQRPKLLLKAPLTKLLLEKNPLGTDNSLTGLLGKEFLDRLPHILKISKPLPFVDTPLKTTTIQRHTFTAGGIKYEMVVGEKPNDCKFSTIKAGKLWQAMSLTQFADALGHLKASQTPEDYAKLEPELKRAWKAHKALQVFSKLDQVIAINSSRRNPDADLRALFTTITQLDPKEDKPPKIIFQKDFKQPQ